MAIVNGIVQGGSSTANQDVWLADYAVTGWASGATLTGDTLSGTTPSEFDGVAQATVITFWGLDRISRIMVTDGGSDKMGLYDIVSLDASTMELQKVAGFGSNPEVNEYVNLTLGDYATQAQSFVFFPAIPAFSQRGSAAKTTKYESEVARTITVSTIYMQNLAGSMSADGRTYTLSSALPANDGYTPSGYPYVALAGQTDQKQNGVYIQTGSTTLARPAWYDSDVEMNNHHRLIIAEGKRYRNSVWIAKASADTIDPTTTTVEYECVEGPALEMSTPSGATEFAHWRFDGDLTDDSANSYDLSTTFGSVSYQRCPFGLDKKAVVLNDSVMLLRLSSGDAAWQTLVKSTGFTAFFAFELLEPTSAAWLFNVIGNGAGAANNRLFVSFLNADRTLNCQNEDPDSTFHETIFPMPIRRHQVVIAIECATDGTYKLFDKDGEIAKDSGTASTPAGGSNAVLALFGAVNDGSTPLKAVVSQLLVVEGSALTEAQITAELRKIDRG